MVSYINKFLVLLVSVEMVLVVEVFIFVMFLNDQVIVIGIVIQGIFLDVLEWVLFGGYVLGFFNEVYLFVDDVWYEGLGILVDIEVLNFLKSDCESGQDLGIEVVLIMLMQIQKKVGRFFVDLFVKLELYFIEVLVCIVFIGILEY